MPEKTPRQHVHIGTGNLGLGLVGWLGVQAGLSVILANRSSRNSLTRNNALRSTNQYELVFADSRTEPVIFTEFLFKDKDRLKLISTVANSRTSILTISLGNGINDPVFLQLLIDALVARVQTATEMPLHVIACENALNSFDIRDKVLPLLPSHLTLSEFERAIIFVSCMVDRICHNLTVSTTADGNQRVRVEVERFAQWSLQRPTPHAPQLEEMLSAPGIEFVDDLGPVERRKRWLINGPHLLIALNAHFRGYRFLHLYLQQDTLADEILNGLLEETAHIFLTIEQTFSLDEIRTFNARTKARFCTEPDIVSRIVHRFKEPQGLKDLEEFFKDFHRKVTDPMLHYMSRQYTYETRVVPFWITHTLFLVTKLINERRYVPPPPE